eukprot:CAMPEP_0117013890 /NCGR_PEP_ID=MMETSP0472-20121206/11378_1 /TAXON_ID=693140 ORGANISM="Tiarina fusus, Strain LIS" /NCGR_SAMPLE_ID=MMETSP0472 /ASSEMBLY_ACC=CAM_ASM_000603 /LENGTH=840 /DNA_ID=CAMNT_0004717327 /DNA_START=144 /DNA_END=2667 /DNA_ORIENTATION=-
MTESDFEFQPTREQSENWTAMKQQRQAIRQQAAGDGTQQDDRGGNMERQSMLLSNHSGVRLGGKLYNLAISFAVFLILFCGACGIIVAAHNAMTKELENEAMELAKETGNFFSHQLDQAILPLFSMAQFVSELDLFSSLTDKVGQVGDPGALPLLPPKEPGLVPTHRNVTGVCDEEGLVNRFNEIAATIKRNSGMEGVLVNLQLAPDAVVCLAYPLINSEDFEDGVVMDNRGAIGHDLQNDPARKFIAEAYCDCGAADSEAVSRLRPNGGEGIHCSAADAMEDQTFLLNGEVYHKWGFAVAIINWNALIERGGSFEAFEERGWEFQLTRTDRNYDADRDEFIENEVILAETDDFDPDALYKSVSTELQTTNNEWKMTVCYADSTPQWLILAVAASCLVSVLIGSLLFVILNQRLRHKLQIDQQNQALLDAARQSAKTERDLNDFIAHEVRNPISAAMSACSFVSSSVNERAPLTTPASREAVRDDVRIIENSLQFVNDLLRNMLDFHRAASNKMILEPTPTDIKADILEPVSSMIYRRYESYEVLVECPDNLVVSVDRLRLKQIILNLARNSAKFVTKGYIRLKAQECDKNGGVCISVEDSGPGIPESKRADMFRRFQDSLDSLHQGTGIGLNLCQTLMDIMGGSIYLDETYHSTLPDCPGARFVVFLKEKPMAVESITDETVEDMDVSSSTSGDSMRNLDTTQELPEKLAVLFVDDDMILRKLFARTVKKVAPGWVIQEAANGEHAIALLEKENHFDLIFMDQYMTSAEKCLLGTETVQALRAIGFNGAVCGLSANDMEQSFLSAGADSFMMKPFPCKVDECKGELQRVLAEHRANKAV